jgi:hypothetical protein
VDVPRGAREIAADPLLERDLTSLPLRRPNSLPLPGSPELELMVERVLSWYALSPQEAMVAIGIWGRCTDAEIAEWLGWTLVEVEARLRHCCTVLRPLDLGTRTGAGEAVVRAMSGAGR